MFKSKKITLSRILTVVMLLALCFSTFSVAYAGPEDKSGTTSATTSVFDDYVQVGESGKVTVADGSDGEALQLGGVVSKYKSVAVVITSILTITMFIFMLVQFTKLGASGDNDSARKKAIAGILTTGIATALFGGASIIIGFFWNFLAGV